MNMDSYRRSPSLHYVIAYRNKTYHTELLSTGQGLIFTNILSPDSHLYQTPLLEKSSPLSCLKW